MVKRKKVKKVLKKKTAKRKAVSKRNSLNTNKIYLGIAAVVVLVIIAFSSEKNNTQQSQKPTTQKSQEVTNVKDNQVSDIKETREIKAKFSEKKLNIPKKKKAINQTRFNEKEVLIRFATLDYNSNKKISLSEYLFYFKNKDQGRKQFKTIDKNKNRSISYEEYLAFKKR